MVDAKLQGLKTCACHYLAQRRFGKVEVVHGANNAPKLVAGTIVF